MGKGLQAGQELYAEVSGGCRQLLPVIPFKGHGLLTILENWVG